MSNKKINQLTEMTSLSGSDLVLIDQNVGGVYTSKKIQVSNFKGEWQLVERKEFAVAATTYIFSGLNGDVDRRYKIIARIINNYNGVAQVAVSCNTDTGTNYNQTRINSVGVVYSANSNETGGLLSYIEVLNEFCFCNFEIDAKSGCKRGFFNQYIRMINGTSISESMFRAGYWTNTALNITQLVCTASQADGIGIGSYIELWKLAQ